MEGEKSAGGSGKTYFCGRLNSGYSKRFNVIYIISKTVHKLSKELKAL